MKVGGAHLLPPSAREASGGEGRLGRRPSGVGGASPRRFVDDKARLSMAALAQMPRRARRLLASQPPPHPYPSPPLGFAERGGEGGARAATFIEGWAGSAGNSMTPHPDGASAPSRPLPPGEVGARRIPRAFPGEGLRTVKERGEQDARDRVPIFRMPAHLASCAAFFRVPRPSALPAALRGSADRTSPGRAFARPGSERPAVSRAPTLAPEGGVIRLPRRRGRERRVAR